MTDDSGYQLSSSDLDFLGIANEAALECMANSVPLGMPIDQYSEFIRTLLYALRREGVDAADIRLQGSSANFFSGPHKQLPFSAQEFAEIYTDEFGRLPSQFELAGVWKRYAEQWPSKAARPLRRPWDSLFVLGSSPVKSDFDIQISSDATYEVVANDIRFSGIDPKDFPVDNSSYGFMRKELSDRAFLYLQAWAARWQEILDRPVNIALFQAVGPREPQADASDSEIAQSSHFRESDWVLHTGPIENTDIFLELVGAEHTDSEAVR